MYIRRKSKVTVAPNNCASGDSKTGRLFIQTAPGRLISVTVFTTNNSEMTTRMPSANLRRPRNGRRPFSAGHTEKERADGSHTSEVEESKVVYDIDQESDSTDQEKGQTVVVVVDVERPKTGDTITSKISLPPLRSGSPVVTAGKTKKLKWNLRRRVGNETKVVDEAKLPKSVSASSISTTVFGENSEDGHKEPPKASEHKRPDSWKDEIVTLPGTAEVDQTPDSGVMVEEFGADVLGQQVQNNAMSDTALFFIHGVGGSSKIWSNQMRFFKEAGMRPAFL